MNVIPLFAQKLLDRQSELEAKLDELHNIINKAARGQMGITLDEARTPEWKETKRMYAIYWSAFREINLKLSKMRRAVGYQAVNGKRVTIYQYKNL